MQMKEILTHDIMDRIEKLNSEINYLSNDINLLTDENKRLKHENELLIKKYKKSSDEQTDKYSPGFLDSLKVTEIGSSKVSIPNGYKISSKSTNGVLFYNKKTYIGIFEVPNGSSFDKKVKEWNNKYKDIKTKTYYINGITLKSVVVKNEENIEIGETYFEKNGIKYHIFEKGVKDKIAFNILLNSIIFNYQLLLDKIQKIPQLSAISFGYSTDDGRIKYHNWRLVSIRGSRPTVEHRTLMEDFGGYCERIWFTRYLKHKFPNEDFKINFFGAYETHHTIEWPMDGKKVFYTAEDLNYPPYLDMKKNHGTYALDYVDLSMGFDLIDNKKYLRFPYWAWAHFSPEVTEEEIENKIDEWNSLNYKKTRDVVNVSSHDRGNTRKKISDDIERIVEITYGGRWRKNTDELRAKYNNSKEEFMKPFKFNLCAENLEDTGYVTEKIFDSIKSACIPLYVGGGNYLEPKILNQDAILRWFMEDTSNNKDTVELFKNIYSDEKTYNEFKDQDILLDSSKKVIINMFEKLEKHFERLIYE